MEARLAVRRLRLPLSLQGDGRYKGKVKKTVQRQTGKHLEYLSLVTPYNVYMSR